MQDIRNTLENEWLIGALKIATMQKSMGWISIAYFDIYSYLLRNSISIEMKWANDADWSNVHIKC